MATFPKNIFDKYLSPDYKFNTHILKIRLSHKQMATDGVQYLILLLLYPKRRVDQEDFGIFKMMTSEVRSQITYYYSHQILPESPRIVNC